jgi:hypothetical protein
MSTDILIVGFELLSVLETSHKDYLEWKHSEEEFCYIKEAICSGINFIISALTKNEKIDNINRIISVTINHKFDKALIFIDSVSWYDQSEVLLAISQAFNSYPGWKEGKVNFNEIRYSKHIYFLVTRVISPRYL